MDWWGPSYLLVERVLLQVVLSSRLVWKASAGAPHAGMGLQA
jgi:hypothetical protein